MSAYKAEPIKTSGKRKRLKEERDYCLDRIEKYIDRCLKLGYKQVDFKEKSDLIREYFMKEYGYDLYKE